MTDRQPFRRLAAATGALLLAALLAATLASAAAAAPPPGLYGATGVLGNDTTPPSDLYRIDPNTGAATSVGRIGYALTGMALDPTSGTLYGVTAAVQLSTTERHLITIDSATGAGTIVGSIRTHHIEDIAFDREGRLYGWNESGDDLATIDKRNGAVANVADSGLGVTWGNGLAFDRNGVLWGMLNGDYGNLWTVNAATGQVARGPRLTGSPNTTGGAGMNAAAFGCDGTSLYAAVNDFGDPPTYLVTVDTARGEITNRGTTVTALDALEWVCPPPGAPPAGPLAGRCSNPRAGTARRERLIGTAFGDSIRGGDGGDVIEGLDGDDCLFGEGGADEVTGDLGNDLVDGGADADRLFGESGRDRVRGGPGRDHLRGSSGHDRVSGGSGRDRVDGGSNNDRVFGGPGRDRLRGGPGRDFLSGGKGRDFIETGSSVNTVRAGSGDDRIFSANGRIDRIRCGAGRDQVRADARDRLTGGCERVLRTR